MILESLRNVPEEVQDGSPLVVLLHGRGSDERDLQGLASFLPRDAILVTPRAPFSGLPWGYGPGWAWYRYEGGRRVADDTLLESLEALDEFLDRLPGSIPVRTGPLVVGGFSQGGTTSLAWALTRPGRAAGIAVFSGFLVDSPHVVPGPGSVEGLDLFWGHGRADPAIPYAMAEESRAVLAEADTKLETADHPGGHTISPDEMRAFRSWLERVVSDAG